jgi:hypothetical protein
VLRYGAGNEVISVEAFTITTGFAESEMQQVVAQENWAATVSDNKIQVNPRISI